jgi:hypothetical protein
MLIKDIFEVTYKNEISDLNNKKMKRIIQNTVSIKSEKIY